MEKKIILKDYWLHWVVWFSCWLVKKQKKLFIYLFIKRNMWEINIQIYFIFHQKDQRKHHKQKEMIQSMAFH